MTPRFLLTLVATGCAWCQSVRILSEFQRIDPFGNIVAADRAESPREILSPAVVRNAYASFFVAATVPAGKPFSLFVGQNPENTVDVSAYRAVFVERDGAWIPDGLAPVKMSDTGLLESAAPQVTGQTTFVFWLDVWTGRNAPVRRIRLELQLECEGRWFIYPMELRILTPRAPRASGPLEAVAPITAPSAESARRALAAYICGGAAAGEDGPLTVRKLIRRNARQDVALAMIAEKGFDRSGVIAEMVRAAGGDGREVWCKSPAKPGQLGAEWYLRVRDYLYRTADRIASSGLPEANAVITGEKP